MQSTHTIHTQSLGHRTQLGKGKIRREGRLVSDYSLNACNEPENLLCAQIRSCCGQMDPDTDTDLRKTDRQTAKNARRTGAAAVHFTSLSLLFSYPLLCHLFLSLSFVFVIQFICFVCSVEGRKKCKRKAAKICGRYWTQQISSRS